MASGAPKPGGYQAPAPGGTPVVPPGGTDLNSRHLRRLYAGYPDFDISPGDGSGARTAQSRSVVNLRLGRAPGAVTYAWTLPTVPGGSTTAVTSLTGATTATAGFTPDVAGTYRLQCAVTFSDGTAITKSVTYVSA